jgi:NitT/TauT family transport system substrate-binding protein
MHRKPLRPDRLPHLGQIRESGRISPDRRRRAVFTAIGAVAAGGMLAPARTRAAVADRLVVRLDWSTSAIHCPFHLCAQRGWFAKAGLDVRIEDGNGSTTTVQMVAGSDYFDLGHAALAPMAIGRGAGLRVISVAGFLRKGDMGILVDRRLEVRKIQDLRGRRLSYTAGSLEGPFVEPFFELNKIPANDLKLLNVESSAKLSSYVSGGVDGIIASVPNYYTVIKTKRPADRFLFADYGLNLPGFGLVARPDVLKAKGDAIRRLTGLLCSAWTYIFNGHEDEALRAVMAERPDSGLDAGQLRDQLEDYKNFFHSENTRNEKIGVQSVADWQSTVRSMEQAKVIPVGSRPEDYFTNAYIDYAFGEGIVGSA